MASPGSPSTGPLPSRSSSGIWPSTSHEKREKKQSVFQLYQYRDFMKKLASIFVRNGKEPLIWIHHTGIMMFPVMSHATMGLSGEIMTTKNKSQFNHVELFDEAAGVVEFNSKWWGVPILWYPDLKYGIYTKNRSDAPLTWIHGSVGRSEEGQSWCMSFGSRVRRVGIPGGERTCRQSGAGAGSCSSPFI